MPDPKAKTPDPTKPKKKKKAKHKSGEDIATINSANTPNQSGLTYTTLNPVMFNNQPHITSPTQPHMFPQQSQQQYGSPQFSQGNVQIMPQQNIYDYQSQNMQTQQLQPMYNQQNYSEMSAWFATINNELKKIKGKLSTLDDIQGTVVRIDSKVAVLDEEVKKLNIRVNDVEQSTNFVSDHFDTQKNSIDSNKQSITEMKSAMTELTNENKNLKEENAKIKQSLTDLHSRSMRENLIFYGIDESLTTTTEDCIKEVKSIIVDKLEIKDSDIIIDRAHRIGRKEKEDGSKKKPRPIVAKFHQFTDKERIRRESHRLKDTDYGISEQFPKEIADKRRILVKIMKHKKSQGETVRLAYDKLYVNNKEYTGPLEIPADPKK